LDTHSINFDPDLGYVEAMGPRRAVSIVATDLDDTLWFDGVVPVETKSALKILAAHGIPVISATARGQVAALSVMEVNETVLPAVLFDGSLGIDFTNGQRFHQQTLDSDTALWMLDSLCEIGIEPCINVDHSTHYLVAGNSPSTNPAHLERAKGWLRYGDLHEIAATEPVLSIGLVGLESGIVHRAQAAIGTVAKTTVSRDPLFGGFTLSARPHSSTKWNGVVAYCESRGISFDEVLAVGDSENDVDLLKSAAVSCASVGACDEVLEIADYRLDDIDKGGWHSILELIL
jgi:hydroxymethylpyrimidine pyrophosphatase-like HAD family hydrolase